MGLEIQTNKQNLNLNRNIRMHTNTTPKLKIKPSEAVKRTQHKINRQMENSMWLTPKRTCSKCNRFIIMLCTHQMTIKSHKYDKWTHMHTHHLCDANWFPFLQCNQIKIFMPSDRNIISIEFRLFSQNLVYNFLACAAIVSLSRDSDLCTSKTKPQICEFSHQKVFYFIFTLVENVTWFLNCRYQIWPSNGVFWPSYWCEKKTHPVNFIEIENEFSIFDLFIPFFEILSCVLCSNCKSSVQSGSERFCYTIF